MESDGRQHPVHLSPNERHNTPVILYVTVCAKDRKPILANPVVHAWLFRTWQENAGWLIGRYMIMPDHIHFFCAPAENPPSAFTAWMKRWKSFSARCWPYRDKFFIWQGGVWNTQLRRHKSYASKWEYVVNNPVRAG